VPSAYERGYIYFLWAGKGIKIGYSRNPFARVNRPEFAGGSNC
jgi:hypothetical protein